MEYDSERPYTVLTRDDLREKINKHIDNISEIFFISKSDAAVLLLNFQWNTLLVANSLSEDKRRLLNESGLKSVVFDSDLDLSDSSCDQFYEFDDDDDEDSDDDDEDSDDLISTPFCSHKFCTKYWREYLEKNFYSLGKNQAAISCPDPDCEAAVGPDTIERLTIQDQVMYESYLLRSYLEGSFMIKQCPAPDCDYSIEFHKATHDDENSLSVVCLCGHIFCWRCMHESHRPVTCNNASDWLSRDLKNLSEESDKSSSLNWIETNTKPCPHCFCPVVLDGEVIDQFLTCACSGRFCWKCLRSEEYHETESGFFEDCEELEILGRREEAEILCLDRWEAAEISMEEAKSDLRAFQESIIKKKTSILNKQYIRIMTEGLMLIVQCRQVLKWSCVYDYFHTNYETSKKEFLRFLQENASAFVQSYSETLKEEQERAFAALTFEELSLSQTKLCTSDIIGNYLYNFIKALEDGLVDVKVRSYDNFAGPYWFCDCCTYGNTWFHKDCKMCYDSTLKT